jgi:hypothetical protein
MKWLKMTIRFNSKHSAVFNEQENTVSIMDGELLLFKLSKADSEAITDLFGSNAIPEKFDPVTKWEIENPELLAAAENKICCLHINSQQVLMADDYDSVKEAAITKYGEDEVNSSCCFFQGPKGPYKMHVTG